MQTNGAKTYSWDARNRLTAIGGTAPTSFAYDVADRRIAKTSPITSNINTQITFDGANPVLEKQGVTVTGANLTGLGIDSYLTRTDGATETYPLTDHLGNVIALTDATGNIVTTYVYEPYGATTQTGAASANPHQYTGRENDGTGLYYYRARYYDPQLMRFISEDPIGLAGGINSYAYVGGNPVSYRDPLGLWSLNAGGYYGIGWEVSVGQDYLTGRGFVDGKVGFGVGATVKYDFLGGIPNSQAGDECRGGVGVRDFLEVGKLQVPLIDAKILDLKTGYNIDLTDGNPLSMRATRYFLSNSSFKFAAQMAGVDAKLGALGVGATMYTKSDHCKCTGK